MSSRKKKRANPFYVLLVVAGTVFAITACAYGVMAVKQLHASNVSSVRRLEQQEDPDVGFVRFMDQHGARLMLIELVVLGVTTVAAIGTDRLWTDDN